ncbi:MAG TPA: LPS assembly protein LptD [Candidatus Sulfotelmatobacter sp.]|nr:LPS assembly protein LptD [Candidatus Sulfotelmatobacter sp.]
MTLRTIFFALALWVLALPCRLHAQDQPQAEWQIESLSGEGGVEYDFQTGLATATNGVLVKYGGAVLTADRVAVNETTGDVVADGKVRIQQGDQLWASEHIRYNFKTRQMEAEQFRTGQAPMFAAGQGLHADLTNHVYTGTNALLTTEDLAKPAMKVRAKFIKIVPGKRFEARHAVFYVGAIPVFYVPYYSRNLGENANNISFTPGYRSIYGPFFLSGYNFFLNEHLDGTAHLDYRARRGPGLGPDLNYHLGPWGEGTFKYYYTHDEDSTISSPDLSIPQDRHRLWLSYQANPATNLNIKSLVRYQSDASIVRDFFQGEYVRNPQPNTFIEANKFWQNFSLDTYVEPRVNGFLQTVERLPDIRLTGFRQQLGETPLYYESESSAGYYRQLFAHNAGTNAASPSLAPPWLDYEAARGDTFHQILLPETFFGWLNLTPRVGGRFTAYSEATGPGARTDEEYRGVFNTGAELNFKASQLWPNAENRFFEVDGIRHIVEPSINYVFVPNPSTPPRQLPQFDYELPSLRLLPIEYPDYNAIDSIDSQNVIRWGLRNRLQTKRDGQLVNLLNWDLYTDWRLDPRPDQNTFADIYSDLTVRPRSWLTLESITRYDVESGQWNLAYHTITFQPNNVWSWGLGHFYLRDNVGTVPTALGLGNNLFSSIMFYRFNENWGFRTSQYFEARDGRLEQQNYTIYRDLRSWTAALTLQVLDNRTGPIDYTIAFTFSLKVAPRFGLGVDTARPYSLLGG